MRDTTYKRQFNLNLPEQIVEAMRAAARRRLMSRSEYIRQAIMKQLEQDGIRPAACKIHAELSDYSQLEYNSLIWPLRFSQDYKIG